MENARADASPDAGYFVLEILLRLKGIQFDPTLLRSRSDGKPVGITEMFSYAKHAGLKARVVPTPWERLAHSRLPAIASLRGGGFVLLGKANSEHAIVLAPGAERPSLLTRSEFEIEWDGRLVFVEQRRRPARLLHQLGKTWRTRASRLVEGARALTKRRAPVTAKQVVVQGRNTRVIDFADRARKLRHSVGFLRPDPAQRRPHELAFLPAALEIVETPPSPVGRAIAFSIIAIFGAGLAWASIGTVDIVAVAPGKLIPSDRTKVIQPFETGVVRSIQVRDGQAVRRGDVLIELDPTMNAAELGRLRSDLLGARLDAARLKAALAQVSDPLAAFAPPEDAPPALIEMHRRFLTSTTAEQKAKLAAIDGQIAQKEAERATVTASIEKLKAVIAPLQQRVEIREQLVQKELGSTLTYLTEMQDLVGNRQEIVIQESRQRETDAAIGALAETRRKTIAEYERGLFDELAKAEQKAAGFAQDVVRAQQRTGLQKLSAPIDGTVQQLAVHTVGGVVTPAQTLMMIVPTDSRVEIEAMISNRDVGFVEIGQDASIKLDAFSFTRYGVLHGKVITISHDAITRNKPPEKEAERSPGAESSSSEPKGQELVYAARVSLDRTYMDIENKRVNLAPGMAATVEIKTGARSIISYLLSPLVRYRQESFRER
jgi:hemolysin D